MTDMFYFTYFILSHLFIADVGLVCVSVQCLKCNVTDLTLDSCQSCPDALCLNDTTYANCKTEFEVYINATGSHVQEGDDVLLTCVHNLPNLTVTYGWKKDGNDLNRPHNSSQLLLKKVFSSKKGHYVCYVNSSCGFYESAQHEVTAENNGIYILLVCGITAVVLILIMTVAMRCKLKRDNDKHRQRIEQRFNQNTPAPLSPRPT